MTPEEEKMWKVLQTTAADMRREQIVAEFDRMIKDKLVKMAEKDADAAIYSAMVKSYYKSEAGDIFETDDILKRLRDRGF